MPNIVSRLLALIHPLLWRATGFVSSIVGFGCYSQSTACHYLIGKWNPLKITIYIAVSFVISMMMLFVKPCRSGRGGRGNNIMRAHVAFFVLILTSVYEYWEEQSEEGKGGKGLEKLMQLISPGAFALMSLSLSRQLQLGFEVGIFYFLLGCLFVTSMKEENLKLAPRLLVVFFCYFLVITRCITDFLLQKHEGGPNEHDDSGSDSNTENDLEANRPLPPSIQPERELPTRSRNTENDSDSNTENDSDSNTENDVEAGIPLSSIQPETEREFSIRSRHTAKRSRNTENDLEANRLVSSSIQKSVARSKKFPTMQQVFERKNVHQS